MLASVEDYKKATEQLNLNLGKTKIVHFIFEKLGCIPFA